MHVLLKAFTTKLVDEGLKRSCGLESLWQGSGASTNPPQKTKERKREVLDASRVDVKLELQTITEASRTVLSLTLEVERNLIQANV